MGNATHFSQKILQAALSIALAFMIAMPQASIAWAEQGEQPADQAQLSTQEQFERKPLPGSEPSLVPVDELKDNNWMAGVSGSLYLHEINIPGTHDSAMWDPYAPRNIAKTMSSYAKTQWLDVGQQMNAGMRLFDIRLTNVYRPGIVGFFGNGENRTKGTQGLYPVHGAYKNWKGDWRFYGDQPKGVLQFSKLMGWFTTFLTQNPTETIIIDITYENDSGDRNVTMARAREQLEPYFTRQNPKTGKPFIYTQNGSKTISTMPTLGETRGQIVLMSTVNELGLGMSYNWTSDWNGRDIAGVHFSVENHFEATKEDKCTILQSVVSGGDYNGKHFMDPAGGVQQNIPHSLSEAPTMRSALLSTASNRPPVVTSSPHQTPEEIAKTVNAFAYKPNSNMLVEPGKLCGWVYSDFMTATEAHAYWRTNITSSIEYNTVTYKATIGGAEITQSLKLEHGSKITLPSNPFGNDASGKSKLGNNQIRSWRVNDQASQAVGTQITVTSNMELTANTGLSWSGLQARINQAPANTNTVINLPERIEATITDTPLVVPKGKDITINMNGHALDRAGRSAASGGVFQVSGKLTLVGSGTITGGFASKGGGILVAPGATFSATNVTIENNKAASAGGGVYASSQSNASLTGCTIRGNIAESGAGAYLERFASFKVSGAMNITENRTANKTSNVQLGGFQIGELQVMANVPAPGATITVQGSLAAEARIGVTSEIAPTAGRPVTVTSGLNGAIGNIISDDAGLQVGMKDNEAILQLATHTVSFNVNGGTPAPQNKTVEHNAKVQAPTEPTKSGAVFAGWYSDDACMKSYNFDAPVTANLTLHAKWTSATAGKHTVTFDSRGATFTPEPQLVENGNKAAEPTTSPTLEGFTFRGWYASETDAQPYNFDTPVTSDLTLFARWTANDYVVAFIAGDGTDIPVQTVANGGRAVEPEAPTWPGYAFEGWYVDGLFDGAPFDFTTPITADTILFAKWAVTALPTHTITFDSNGGSAVAPQTIQEGDAATEPPSPTSPYGSFAGWYEELDEPLTAEEIAILESDPSLEELVWVAEGKVRVPYDFGVPVYEDITVFARWYHDDCIVTYNDQDSIVAIMEVEKGDKAPNLTFDQIDGFSFEGWCTDQSLSQLYDFNAPVTGDITLYASWITNSCTVTFNSEGGSAVAPQEVPCEEYATVPDDPVKEGYAFEDWYLDLGFNPTDEELAQLQEVETGYDFDFTDLLWRTGDTTMIRFDLAQHPIEEDIELHARWSESKPSADPSVDDESKPSADPAVDDESKPSADSAVDDESSARHSSSTASPIAKTGDTPWLLMLACLALAALCVTGIALAKHRVAKDERSGQGHRSEN